MWAHLRIQNTGTRMTRIELISLIKPGKTVKGYPISIKTLNKKRISRVIRVPKIFASTP